MIPFGFFEDSSGGGASIIPYGEIISRYTFEDNLNDVVGTKDGSGAGITYASNGAVTKNGVFNNTPMTIGNSTDFAINGNMTISFMFRATSFPDKAILFQYGSYSSWGAFNLFTDGNFYFLWEPDGPAGVTSHLVSQIILVDTWYHFVFVRDYDDLEHRSYVDGIHRVANDYDITGETQSTQSTGDALVGGGYAGDFNGDIDEVILWDRVLTQAEITELATVQMAGTDITP